MASDTKCQFFNYMSIGNFLALTKDVYNYVTGYSELVPSALALTTDIFSSFPVHKD